MDIPKFTTLNQYFQSENVVLNTLHSKMEITYKDILITYIRRDYVLKTPLANLDPMCKSQIKNQSEIYFGVKIMNYITLDCIKVRPDLLKEFYSKCVHFLQVSCCQIKKRYNFYDSILPLLNIFTPSITLSVEKRSEYNANESITCLTQQLTRIVNDNSLQTIDDQWRLLSLVALPDNIINEKEPDQFWVLLKNLKSGQFNELAMFVLSVMSLPNSNASCERIFSKINRVKTKSRNELITNTVSSTIMASECIKRKEGSCYNFQPWKEIFDSMTSTNLYPKKTEAFDEIEDFYLDLEN